MEGPIPLFGQDHEPRSQAQRQSARQDQFEPIGRHRRFRRHGRIHDAHLADMLGLFHRFGKLRVFVALEHGEIEILRHLVIALQLLELLRMLWRPFDPPLDRGGFRAQPLLIRFEIFQFVIKFAQGVLDVLGSGQQCQIEQGQLRFFGRFGQPFDRRDSPWTRMTSGCLALALVRNSVSSVRSFSR